jgi:glycosyltransferase involved in cell wall biosynthesis
MAWIDWALSTRWADAQFVARTASGLHAIDRGDMPALLAALRGKTSPTLDMRGAVSLKKRPAVRRAESLLRRLSTPPRPADVYANVGHSNLSLATITEMRVTGAAHVIVKIHDVIPLNHPDFARADGPVKMRERLDAAALADGLVFNSNDTAIRALALMKTVAAHVVAPLGIDFERFEAHLHDGFVCLGTIEPRKNHALLLDVWEAMMPPRPQLHIIGRRGWLNKAVFARLDAGVDGVVEHDDLDDAGVRHLLAGAQALLFPSFAEGYGLPMVEALAMGVPVIASDLPALREVGGDAAMYLAPDDPAAWVAAIKAPPNRADLSRADWKPQSWAEHFENVDELLTCL